MKTDKTRSRFILLAALWLAVTVIMVYIANHYVPFMMDDLWYSTILSDETPIRGIKDIVKAEIWHYNNWGGRSMTHSILQLTLLTGETCADLLNTVVTLILSGLIALSATGDFLGQRNLRGVSFACITGMLLGLNANWKMSMFWQSGAANYLYITCFIVLFAYCYIRELPTEIKGELPSVSRLKLIEVFIVPLGILAGWSNENTGPVCFLLAVFVIGYLLRRHRKPAIWMYEGAVTTFIGSLLVILAPGNFERSAEDYASEFGIIWKLFLRCYYEARGALEYLFPALVVFFGLLIVLKAVGGRLEFKEWIYLAMAVLSWGAMILSPHYPDRATFASLVFIIIACISMAARAVKINSKLRPYMLAAAVLVWLRGMYLLGEFISMSIGWIL